MTETELAAAVGIDRAYLSMLGWQGVARQVVRERIIAQGREQDLAGAYQDIYKEPLHPVKRKRFA